MSDRPRELEIIQLHIVQCDDIQVRGRESGSSRHTALHASPHLCPLSLFLPSFLSPSLPTGWIDKHTYDGIYGVILRIVKAGCHPVAIAQVVEH